MIMTISQDDRKALANGAKLLLNGNEYIIDAEIGRGGSCIVYTATQLYENRMPQTVRIKECYPAYLDISRSADDSLSVPEKSRLRFDASIQRSQRIFSLNQKLRNTNGLTNSTIDSSEMVFAKGTVYIVMRCIEGLSYINEVDDCIRSVLIRVLALMMVLKKYHENGYLHLDVKPENIFVIPETKEHILLFDYDSMLSFDEIKNGKARFSCSEGYTAPEVLRMDIRSINIRADIYSVGALVYSKLFGSAAKSLSVSDHIEFSGLKFPDIRYQPIFLRKLSTFFFRTLSTSPAARYRSDEELIHSLEELISLSDLSGSQIISNFTADPGCFTGRFAELQRISAAFSRSHIVLRESPGRIPFPFQPLSESVQADSAQGTAECRRGSR